MASTESNKTISLAEFAERATQGQALEQKLETGETVAVRVFTPPQADMLDVQRLMVRIFKVAESVKREADISEDNATLAYELGLRCLQACVRADDGAEMPDAALVALFSSLPYKSALMVRCQELCGVTMISIPPINNALAIEAVKQEADELAAEIKAAGQNRKTRRAAAKKG